MEKRKRRIVLPVWGLLALGAGVAFVAFLHYVPFDLPSFVAWGGIGVGFLGLVCLVRPLRFLGVRKRSRALVVIAVGAALTAIAVFWPASVRTVAVSSVRLDDLLPEYQFVEYHQGRVKAPRERVLEAVQMVSLADMPAAVFLMRLRAMADGDFSEPRPDPIPILRMMEQPGSGFLPLDVSDPAELVYGMVGRPWAAEAPPPVTTPEQFLAFAEPGHIKVAFDIRVQDEGNGVFLVSTETRTLGNDADARRVFARYWRLIYPGSAIIRRVWLDAIIARAERPHLPQTEASLLP